MSETQSSSCQVFFGGVGSWSFVTCVRACHYAERAICRTSIDADAVLHSLGLAGSGTYLLDCAETGHFDDIMIPYLTCWAWSKCIGRGERG